MLDLFTIGSFFGLILGVLVWMFLGVCGKMSGLDVLRDAVLVGGTWMSWGLFGLMVGGWALGAGWILGV